MAMLGWQLSVVLSDLRVWKYGGVALLSSALAVVAIAMPSAVGAVCLRRRICSSSSFYHAAASELRIDLGSVLGLLDSAYHSGEQK